MSSIFVEHISAAQQQRLEDYFHLFSIIIINTPPAFLYWDHIITFPDELQYLWTRSMGWSTALFFFNRYFATLGNIVVTVSLFSSGLTESLSAIPSVSRAPPGFNSSNRLHKRMLSYMLVTGFTLGGLAIHMSQPYNSVCDIFWPVEPVGTDLNRMPHSTDIDNVRVPCAFFGFRENVTVLFLDPFPLLALSSFGCNFSLLVEVAAAWEALFLYDSILFIMTLHKAYKTRHDLRQERLRIPLVVIILRDGSIYFGILTLSYEAHYARLQAGLACAADKGMLKTISMSVTMMSRLMLNLHKIAETGLYTSHITTSSPHDTDDQNTLAAGYYGQ
ncbi:hypothetical protein F5880DRAFT_1507986 [Lentinula raphanica]|nr:hypothetical protein F5880DRAFT_1507986 [Lentinula raphanica]